MILAFTNDDWRAAVADLREAHRTTAAKFRASMAEHLAEPAWKALLGRLESSSPEFREIWARHEVVSQGGRAKHIRNAHVGLLHLEHTNLWLGPTTGPRLISYVPLDDESRARLEKIQALALAEV